MINNTLYFALLAGQPRPEIRHRLGHARRLADGARRQNAPGHSQRQTDDRCSAERWPAHQNGALVQLKVGR